MDLGFAAAWPPYGHPSPHCLTRRPAWRDDPHRSSFVPQNFGRSSAPICISENATMPMPSMSPYRETTRGACFAKWDPLPDAPERFRREFGTAAKNHWFSGPLELAGLRNLVEALNDPQRALNAYHHLHIATKNAAPYWRGGTVTRASWWRRWWQRVRDRLLYP